MKKIILTITILFTLYGQANTQYTKTFSPEELSPSNTYFCTLAKARGASESILFSNGCE